MKTLKEKIEVMQAAEDGAEIEFMQNGFDNWQDTLGDPVWSWPGNDYRIKPKPREFFWINLYSKEPHLAYVSKDKAEERGQESFIETIKVREVIE